MDEVPQGTAEVRTVDGVVVITLTRPGFSNRLTTPMLRAAQAALEAARTDRTVVGCVLTGHGDVFCAGGDFRGAGNSSAGRLEFARAHNDLTQAMTSLGKPLVAAVNGNAHAGGFALLAVCDLAVVAHGATLGLPEAAHGLFPLLALALVKDCLPPKLMFEIIYRGRLLSAEEAMAVHLVNEVAEPSAVLDRAIALAGSTRHCNPDIISLGRDLFYNLRGAPPHQANEQARFALAAALKAMEESASTTGAAR